MHSFLMLRQEVGKKWHLEIKFGFTCRYTHQHYSTDKYCHSRSHCARTASFHITSNSLFINSRSYSELMTLSLDRSGVHKSRPTKFCTEAPNICGYCVRNLVRVTPVVPRILRWLLNFREICTPPSNKIVST